METDRLDTAFETSHYKPMTLICPAYNEEAGVVPSVNSLISLRYPEFQVVVVNDGSRDDTVRVLAALEAQHPFLRVVHHRAQRGIADALRTLACDVAPADGGGVTGVVFRGRRYDTGDRLSYLQAVVRLACEREDLGPDLRAWLKELVATL